MLRLGLERISLLMRGVSTPWRAIHVAGTNGKGSVCAYIASMLHSAEIRTGRFNSPHLVDRWDCITIDEQTVSKPIFDAAEAIVKQRDIERSIGASEFELLTATAFEIFTQEAVEVAIVECGMGGRLDATNVIEEPLATVITQIGLDHQAFLGDTVFEIAREKAGIIKPNSDCFVLGSNTADALNAIDTVAQGSKARMMSIQPPDDDNRAPWESSKDASQTLDGHLRSNMNLAWTIIESLKPRLASLFPRSGFASDTPDRLDENLSSALRKTVVPGRSQLVDLQAITGRRQPVFCDGGHNALGFEALNQSVKRRGWRMPDEKGSITWLVAISSGRDPEELTRCIRKQDNVVATEFGPVDGMPWVKPCSAQTIIESLPASTGVVEIEPENALKKATRLAEEGPLVVAGSLYLLSEVFRIKRNSSN